MILEYGFDLHVTLQPQIIMVPSCRYSNELKKWF